MIQIQAWPDKVTVIRATAKPEWTNDIFIGPQVGYMGRTLFEPDGVMRSAGNVCVNAKSYLQAFIDPETAQRWIELNPEFSEPNHFDLLEMSPAELKALLSTWSYPKEAVLIDDESQLPFGSHIWLPTVLSA